MILINDINDRKTKKNTTKTITKTKPNLKTYKTELINGKKTYETLQKHCNDEEGMSDVIRERLFNIRTRYTYKGAMG